MTKLLLRILQTCARDNRAGFFAFGACASGTAPSDKELIMPFQKGQSGNPAGRPPGSFRPSAMLAQQLLFRDAEAIIRKTIEHA